MARRRPQAHNSTGELQLFFKPRSEAQKEAIKCYQENDIVFYLGPAGSAKTFTAVYCAVADLLARIKLRRVDRVYITRPTIGAGEDIGFLPGELQSKYYNWVIPIHDCVGKLVEHSNEFIEEFFEMAPLCFLRGRTMENCVAILDEAQNCTLPQLKMFLTRLGVGGKLIITGDTDQSDIGKQSGLSYVVNKLEGEKGIGVFRFTDTDIVRHALVSRILSRLNK